MDVGKRIRAVRQQRGMSLRDLARRSGVSKAYLSQLENNPDRKPSIDVVVRIASALGVPLLELIKSSPPATAPDSSPPSPPPGRPFSAGDGTVLEKNDHRPWSAPAPPATGDDFAAARLWQTAEGAGMQQTSPAPPATPDGRQGQTEAGSALGVLDSSAPVEPDQLPWALRLFWEEHPDASAAEVRSLAAITWCGRRPFTPTDYWVLYQVLSGMMRGR